MYVSFKCGKLRSYAQTELWLTKLNFLLAGVGTVTKCFNGEELILGSLVFKDSIILCFAELFIDGLAYSFLTWFADSFLIGLVVFFLKYLTVSFLTRLTDFFLTSLEELFLSGFVDSLLIRFAEPFLSSLTESFLTNLSESFLIRLAESFLISLTGPFLTYLIVSFLIRLAELFLTNLTGSFLTYLIESFLHWCCLSFWSRSGLKCTSSRSSSADRFCWDPVKSIRTRCEHDARAIESLTTTGIFQYQGAASLRRLSILLLLLSSIHHPLRRERRRWNGYGSRWRHAPVGTTFTTFVPLKTIDESICGKDILERSSNTFRLINWNVRNSEQTR